MKRWNKLVVGLTFVSALALSASNSFAHELGVLGGLNFSSMSIDPSPKDRDLSGRTLGVFGLSSHFDLGSDFGIEVDVLNSRFGMSQDLSFLGVKGVANTDFNYLSIPVLVRYQVIPQFLRIGVGGYYSIGLGDISVHGDGVDPFTGEVKKGSNSVSYKTLGFNKYDYGLVGSLQGSVPVTSNVSLIADARYNLGLANLIDSKTESVHWRNFSVLVGANYSFN